MRTQTAAPIQKEARNLGTPWEKSFGYSQAGLEARAADLLKDHKLTPSDIIKHFLQWFELAVPSTGGKGRSGSSSLKPPAPPPKVT